MNETEFHRVADATLTTLSDVLEEMDGQSALDVELQNGIMTIELNDGKQFIVSKHAPTKQLWLSSPVSGGLHFSFAKDWALADGRTLSQVLSQELKTLAAIEVQF